MRLDPPRAMADVVARLRWHAARRPWIARLLVAGFALVAAAGVVRAQQRADAARDAWGEPIHVVVATSDIAPGEPLAGAVESRPRPQPLVPPAALHETPEGAVARQRIGAGEIVVAVDVAAPGGPAALIPDGSRAVAIAVARSARPPVAVGDGVAVVAGAAELSGGVVIGVDDDQVVVAVPAERSAEVAGAAATGEATIVWEPEPSS